ncbi:MAG: hypothetical protein NVSMB6_18110 [Burkholderiaceae bacterium]
MNDLPTFSDSAATGMPSGAMPASRPAPGVGSMDHRDVRGTLWQASRWIYLALTVLATLVVGLWITNRLATSELRDETARRLKSADVTSTEMRILVKSLSDTARDLHAKVSVLESRQVEAQSQQLALEQLYRDLSKNRDDWALAEIEQVLSTASQQLQLAGNVQGALIALQNADGRLSRSDKPQFIVIRRALAHDIERLKALPNLDVTGIALRLDSIIGQIDAMPLLADEKPALPAARPSTSRQAFVEATKEGAVQLQAARKSGLGHGAQVVNGNQDIFLAVEKKWQSWANEIWSEIRQLIRVRKVDMPDALLLSPDQAYYARENLKLRLLTARLALLSRNESAFRSDMIASQEAITRYFDTRARQTQAVQASLRQVQGSRVAIELPTLAESLSAVRNYKAKS